MARQEQFLKSLALILVAGIIIIAVSFAFTSGQVEKRTLDVSGKAELFAEPEDANLFVTAETRNVSAKASQQQNAAIVERVIAALQSKGIQRNAIETSFYSLQPVYEHDEKQQRSVLAGYVTSHQLKITLKASDDIGSIIDSVVDSGISRIDSISFDISDARKEEMKQQALAKASSAARAKADLLATALGARIAGINTITESSVFITPFESPFAAAAPEAAKTEILPGRIKVSASVSVSFLLA